MKNRDNIKFWQGFAVTRTLTHCWRKCKMVQPLRKIVCKFLTKLNIYLYKPDFHSLVYIQGK